MSKRKKIAVFATEPVTGKIGGLGIRQLEVARELSRHFDVRLLTPFKVGRHSESFPIRKIIYEQPSTFRPHVAWSDVVYSIALSVLPVARKLNRPVAADLLVPEYFENLEGMPLDIFHAQEKCERFGNTISRTARLLTSADFFLAPTERGRDFYLGQLTLLGRLRPDDYAQDPQFRSLIDVAPFGIPSREPKTGKTLFRGKLPGVGEDDFLLLWGGSLANWFDALTPVKAVARLVKKFPQVKLIFTGSKHPVWGKLPKAYDEIIRFARSKGLMDKNVFIYTDWVPYEDRDYYLGECNAGVSTFYDHIENHFSFRIRVLDYLWGNLPILTNPGNTQSELIEREGLGRLSDFGDPKALADQIQWMVQNPAECETMRDTIRRIKPRFHWDQVLEPLVRFCHNPRRAASLFDEQGIPKDRRQTSSTFVFNPEQFAETVPHHPHMLLVQARQAVRSGNRESASECLQQYLDVFGDGLETPLFRNSLFDLQTEFDTDELLQLLPDHPHAPLLHARQALDEGDPDRAQALVEEDIEQFGETPEAAFMHGLILQHRGWFDSAARRFQEVADALPGHLPFLLPLADCLVQLNKPGKARRLYLQAWKESFHGPHSGEEWLRTRAALALSRLDKDKRPELETLQRYFKRDRTNETLAHLIAAQLEITGQHLVEQGNGDAALQFYENAWKLNGKTAGEGWIRVVAAMNIAGLKRGENSEVDTLTHCLNRDPENERLAYAVASTLERQGRKQEARDMFQRFTTQFKDRAILGSVWYRLALLSPKPKQKQLVRKCLSLYPAHRAARELLRSL